MPKIVQISPCVYIYDVCVNMCLFFFLCINHKYHHIIFNFFKSIKTPRPTPNKGSIKLLFFLLVLSQAEGVVAAVEGDELGLEEDVAVDAEGGVAARLETTEAGWVYRLAYMGVLV